MSRIRNRSRKTERRTPNIQRRTKRKGERLRGGAAEGAGERRSDVGGDDYLFGRFFRLHLFAAARGDPRWRVEHPTMLDDVFDLRTVEGLELKQRFGNDVQLVAIGGENLLRPLVRFIEERAHFAIDFLGGSFAVIARARDVAPEKNVIFVVAILDHSQFFAHAPLAYHPAGGGGSHLDIAASAIRDIAKSQLLGHATAHADGEAGE